MRLLVAVWSLSLGCSYTVIKAGEPAEGGSSAGGAGSATFRVGTVEPGTGDVIDSLPPARSISAGGDYTCAIRADQSIACWGTPEQPHGQVQSRRGAFVEVSAGRLAACALTDERRVECWGGSAVPEAVPDLSMTQIDVNDIACGITAEGAAVCWGESSPVVDGVPDGRFVQICSGGSFACAIRHDGSIVCWGDGSFAATAPPSGRFLQIACEPFGGVAIHEDGAIAAWGLFSSAVVLGEGPFSMVSVGDGYCALRTDGEVVCGGIGTSYEPSCPESPACGQGNPPSDHAAFSEIAVGFRHSCGLAWRDDGVPQVSCWGYTGGGLTSPPADLRQ